MRKPWLSAGGSKSESVGLPAGFPIARNDQVGCPAPGTVDDVDPVVVGISQRLDLAAAQGCNERRNRVAVSHNENGFAAVVARKFGRETLRPGIHVTFDRLDAAYASQYQRTRLTAMPAARAAGH